MASDKLFVEVRVKGLPEVKRAMREVRRMIRELRRQLRASGIQPKS